MKRATLLRVRDERLPLQSDDRADILDSDARQRAEIRRLKKLARLVVTETDADENGDMPHEPREALLVLRVAAEALAPKRRARK